MLARAFVADPMVVWPMVSAEDLEARIRQHFEMVAALNAAKGCMYQAGGGLGAMSLIPPDGGEGSHEIDTLMARAMAAITPDGGERYGRFWAWIEGCHPAERHWLLDMLAVDPDVQGRGIGTAMLRFAMERAAADRLPLFLETGVARNVAFYERHGFTEMRSADAPDGGPHVWFMRRDAGA